MFVNERNLVEAAMLIRSLENFASVSFDHYVNLRCRRVLARILLLPNSLYGCDYIPDEKFM